MPSVQELRAATPDELVCTEAPVIEPPPAETENVIDASATAFPFTSATVTEGATGTWEPTVVV